jgi:hypothetical protein
MNIPVLRESLPDSKESLQKATSEMTGTGIATAVLIGSMSLIGNFVYHESAAPSRAKTAYSTVQSGPTTVSYGQIIGSTKATIDMHGSALRVAYSPGGLEMFLSPQTKEIRYYDIPPYGSIDRVETTDFAGNDFAAVYSEERPAPHLAQRDYSQVLEQVK